MPELSTIPDDIPVELPAVIPVEFPEVISDVVPDVIPVELPTVSVTLVAVSSPVVMMQPRLNGAADNKKSKF
ncbi:MAG: hypothetical protein AAGF11_41385 [Myxococcota bacterium]